MHRLSTIVSSRLSCICPSVYISKRSTYVAYLLIIGTIELNPGPVSTQLNFGLINARSAVKKASLIHDVIADYRLDLLVITETWIPSDAPNAVKLDTAPSGYRIVHAHRGTAAEGRGGGIAVVYRETVNLSVVDFGHFGEFESLFVKINSSESPVIVSCIYRIPGSVSTAFCNDISDILEQLMLSDKRYIVCGDFNCPGGEDATIDDHLNDVLLRYNHQQ